MSTSGTIKFNNYDITNYVYPSDLVGNAAYGGNKVVFFINVSSNSKKIKDGKLMSNSGRDFAELWDVPESDQVKISAGGEAAAAVSEISGLAIGTMKRLSVAIALYIPNALNQMTSVGWGEEDLSSVIGDVMDSMTKSMTEAGENIKNASGVIQTASAAGMGALSTAGGAIKTAGASGIAQKLKSMPRAQRFSRQTPGNTKQELLFNNVNFRDFDFNYQFAPKSEKEAENVLNIIRMFKHHMLPEYADDAKSMYIYPSEFNVKYYKGTEENTFIEKQITAVLQSVGIDYTPNGQFNTFKNGMPQQINLTLRFKELSTPSKETSPFDSHGV